MADHFGKTHEKKKRLHFKSLALLKQARLKINQGLLCPEAYIRPERKHLFEYGLHKTRTTCMNSSRPSSRRDRSNDDVVCFRALCNLQQWLERANMFVPKSRF